MTNTIAPVHATRVEIEQIEALRKQLKRIFACVHSKEKTRCEPVLVDPETGTKAEIPFLLVQILNQAADVLAEGGAVAIMPYHAKLTTQEAADYLGVSRPYLISLLDDEDIPFERLRSHRRILLKDLEAFRTRRDAARRSALAELARESYRLGLYDLPEDVDDTTSRGGE